MATTAYIADTFSEQYTRNQWTGCWEWKRSANPGGYGNLKVRGKVWIAHRFSYELYVAKIPDGLHVLHKCDNRKCVNPDHLFLGTDLDNVRDRIAKGRSGGKRVGKPKITAQQAAEIRSIYARGGLTLAQVGALFGIRRSQVSNIVRNASWRA